MSLFDSSEMRALAISLGVFLFLVLGLFASQLSIAPSASAQVGSAVTSAQGARSFGGKVVAIYHACLNGGIWVSIVQPPPKQPSTIALIWTPATVTHLWGPPKNIGQSVLGTFDSAYGCVVSVTPPVVLPGFRMTNVGTSLF